jgi:hypothetical protein
MEFVAHNIELGNGKLTIPNGKAVLESTQRWKSIQRTLELMFNKDDFSNLKVVDLGCLEGGYSIAFARMGFNVVGIDARKDNLERADWAKDQIGLTNVTYIMDDVKNLNKYGPFDIIFCGGLLYHLDKPSEFIRLMYENSNKLVFIHTHYSLEKDSFYDNRLQLNFAQRAVKKAFGLPNYHYNEKNDFRLSTLELNEGYKGRWFFEFGADSPKKEIEKNSEASYSNYKSFWHTKPELLRCFRECRFSNVYEQFDFIDDAIGLDYTERFDRGMFVLVK